jgi:hypothetical protein
MPILSVNGDRENWRRCIRSWTSIDDAPLLAVGEPHDLSSRTE